jgi:hypothetical protein
VQVGDLVREFHKRASPEYGAQTVGIIVGINPLDGRLMVQWNGMPKPYPEPRHYLKVISDSDRKESWSPPSPIAID